MKQTTTIFSRYVPLNNYSPNHFYVKSWVFPFDNSDDEPKARHEAELASMIAQVGEDNGLNQNEIHKVFPFILRMLKSTSTWSK